jgi:cellulose synthase/poly-beta-1,6-N-acetylglucosamine synthase-like glycosyltransferase
MNVLEVVFWCCAALVVYTYALYPLLMAVAARLRPDRRRQGPFAASVSFVLAVHNEEARIGRRLDELIGLLAQSGRAWEILVASDGSTDATVARAQSFAGRGVRVIEMESNVGKAAALSRACAEARHDILILGDVRQTWAADALDKLLRNFADPRVGAVSGELLVETSSGVMAGVGLYWRYEKWLRRNEGRVHSTVGVTGAICAVRRELFRPIPAGTVLDDVYWPLRVVMQGYRVIHDHEANAFDRLPENPRDEFRRKVRTLSGNFQLLALLPGVVLPGHCPLWFQFLSHKVLRLAVPWALLVMLACCALLDSPLYWVLLGLQLAGYALGLIGLVSRLGARLRLASAAGSFLVLNTAAWLAFWVWATGRTSKSWRKVHYQMPPRATPQDTAACGLALGSANSQTAEPVKQ